MKRIAAAALILALAGCAKPDAPVLSEPLIIEPIQAETSDPSAKVTDCVPGEDDGLGGTGCSVD